jgi:hypothetical protein
MQRGVQEYWGSAERWLISFSTTVGSKQAGSFAGVLAGSSSISAAIASTLLGDHPGNF